MVGLTYATYGGLPVLSVDYLLEPGAEAGMVVVIMVPPEGTLVPATGPLQLFDKGNVLTFSNCAIKNHKMHVSRHRRGASYWTVLLEDRRWRWRQMTVCGRYNQRAMDGSLDVLYDENGGDLESTGPEKKQNVRDLATLLLDAMEEYDVSVDSLPDTIYPSVEWDYANPGVELAKLCASYGHDLVLGTDDCVHLIPRGEPGQPDDYPSTNIVRLYPSGSMPSELLLVGGKTVVQADYELGYMGYEKDGRLVPLDEVSYGQATWRKLGGWNLDWITDTTERSYAYASAFRAFRPIGLMINYDIDHGWLPNVWQELEGPNTQTACTNIEQMLPLLPHLLETAVWINEKYLGPNAAENLNQPSHYRLPDSRKRSLQPRIGTVNRERGYSLSNQLMELEQHTTAPSAPRYDYMPEFDLDHKTGLLLLDAPLPTSDYWNAIITLRCAHHVRHPETGMHLRFTKSVPIPGGTGGTVVVRDESLVRTVIYKYSNSPSSYWPEQRIETNEDELQDQADRVAAEAMREYTEVDQDQEFIGYVPIPPHAHVKRVHFQMRINDAAFTTVRYRVAATTTTDEEES